MAIYNNREVWLNSNIKWAKKLPDQVSVRDRNGQNYTVNSNALKFTKDEIKAMQVEENDPLNTLPEATEEDLKAIRVGAAPVADMKEVASIEVQNEEQKKVNEENLKKAKAEAQKDFDKKVK